MIGVSTTGETTSTDGDETVGSLISGENTSTCGAFMFGVATIGVIISTVGDENFGSLISGETIST